LIDSSPPSPSSVATTIGASPPKTARREKSRTRSRCGDVGDRSGAAIATRPGAAVASKESRGPIAVSIGRVVGATT
jgi:hypothetical protein